MEPVMVVVYDRRGHVRFRQRLAQLPATFGRSPACDVILDDRSISATHARLELDELGRLVLKDAGSKNGLRVGSKRVPEVVFPVARAVLVGGTRIAVMRPSDPVEKTEVRRRSFLDVRWTALPALALLASAEVAMGWLGSDELKLLKLVAEEVLPVILGIAGWALCWSIASRLAQGMFRFVAHFSLAALVAGAARWLGNGLVPLLGFSFHLSQDLLRWVTHGGALLAGVWLLAQHLDRAATWSTRRSWVIAAVVAVAIGAPLELSALAKADDFDTALGLPRDTFPPAVAGKAKSLDEFLKATEPLQVQADQLRRR